MSVQKTRRGQKMSDADRAKLPMLSIIQNAKKFIRTDNGTGDATKVQKDKVLKLAEERGLNITEDGANFCAENRLEARKETRDGIAERVRPSLDDAERRIRLILGGDCPERIRQILNGDDTPII